jgi:hypothetical protein
VDNDPIPPTSSYPYAPPKSDAIGGSREEFGWGRDVSVVPEYEDKEFGCICEGARTAVGKTAFDEQRLVALVAGCVPGGRDTDTGEVLTFMKKEPKHVFFE